MNKQKIAFIDSGVGGLIFAIESIKNLAKNYDISNLSAIHIGDTANMPYGLKTQDELLVLITNLIEKAISFDAKIVIIACNTACTAIDDEFIENYKKKGINVIEIITESSKKILHSTELVENQKNIAILGTKRTVDSEIYKNALLELHNDSDKELNIYQYSPVEWEYEIENNIPKKLIQQAVNNHLDKFRNQIGDVNFKKINNIGLFCTHYPYFAKEISEYFQINGMQVELISQGEIFAEIIQKEIKLKNKNTTSQIEIQSYITGNETKGSELIIKNIYPDIKINFKTI